MSGKLVLQPAPEYVPTNQQSLTDSLTDIGLIGAIYEEDAASYLPGSRFLQLISFLGCSPHVRLEPPPDGSNDFCHICFLGPFERPRLLYAGNSRPPRCPACGKVLSHWRELLTPWSDELSKQAIHCPSCNSDLLPIRLNWPRNAGYGRFFIQIHGIFPEEAVPLPELMECLQADGDNWRYFYLFDLPAVQLRAAD